MKEINDEIKLTINTMQCDIDDGTHGELQNHLFSLLEIKRNEIQQRLVERSWAEPALGVDKANPLTTEELKAGGWWCADGSEECRLVFVGKGINTWSDSWERYPEFRYCFQAGTFVIPATSLAVGFKQIHRVGNDFYWGDK